MRKLIPFILILFLFSSTAWAGADVDGTDDYGTMTETGMPGATSAISLFAVGKIDTITGSRQIFAQGDRNNVCQVEGINLGRFISAGKMSMAKVDSTATAKRWYINSSNSVVAGDYFAVAATMSADAQTTAKIRLSVNGGAGTEASGSTLWYNGCGYSDTANNRRVAAEKNNTGNTNYFDGIIYELAEWNTTLTSAQLTQLTDSWVKGVALQIAPSSLVFYFQMNETPDGSTLHNVTSKDFGPDANPNTITWNYGANTTGMSSSAERVMTYQ